MHTRFAFKFLLKGIIHCLIVRRITCEPLQIASLRKLTGVPDLNPRNLCTQSLVCCSNKAEGIIGEANKLHIVSYSDLPLDADLLT